MESYVINARRRIHEYPEIGFDLDRTLAFLREELDKMGVEYTEKFGKSSIVATINPEKTNFTIGIRADIDALPITEESDFPFKSKIDGQMHACGHDAHAAIALDACRRLNEMKDELACRVKILFQAAEEYPPSGAKLMALDGVMTDIDCIIALHVDTDRKAGEIAIRKGPRNATSDGFYLEFYGKTAHAASQEKGIDARVETLTLKYSGRYIAENEHGNGILKLIINNKHNNIIGVHMIGSYASEIIYGAAMMVETEMRVTDIQKLVFPHPTVCEVIREAMFE